MFARLSSKWLADSPASGSRLLNRSVRETSVLDAPKEGQSAASRRTDGCRQWVGGACLDGTGRREPDALAYHYRLAEHAASRMSPPAPPTPKPSYRIPKSRLARFCAHNKLTKTPPLTTCNSSSFRLSLLFKCLLMYRNSQHDHILRWWPSCNRRGSLSARLFVRHRRCR